jgi:ATP-binding cassette subfamily F protein 3
MRYIKLHELEKSFEENRILFTKLSLLLSEGDICGIIGRNGEGKSTILKLITGEITADTGQVEISPNTTIGYHTQYIDPRDNDSISVEQYVLNTFGRIGEVYARISGYTNVDKDIDGFIALQTEFEELGGYAIQNKLENALQQLGLFTVKPESLVSSLSGGQKTRLQLSRLLIQDPDILLLDEPTNHLDFETINWLENYIKHRRGITIIVSHDRTFLNNTVNKILELEKGKTKFYLGNYDEYLDIKERNELFNERQSEIANRKVNTLKDAVNTKISQAIKQHYQRPDKKQYGRHSRTIMRNKAGKKAKQAKHMQARLEGELEKIHDMQSAVYRNMKFTVESIESSGDFVLRMTDYDVQIADKLLVNNASIVIGKGERVLIKGPNGSGKTTMIKNILSLFNDWQSGAGLPENVKFGGNISIGYYSQEHETILLDKTVLEDFRHGLKMTESDALPYLYRMAFDFKQLAQKTSSLSQGEKSRLALAKLLALQHNVLILDEPTNHLDIKNKEILETALQEYEGTIICVSHDRYFVEQLGITTEYTIKNCQLIRE